jgi:hypothetical protein
LRTSALSGWSYWAFLGTLAASYAVSGDFGRAAAWQRVALRLAPPDHRADAETSLQSFEARLALRDPGYSGAAGEPAPSEPPSPTELAELRGELHCLLELPMVALH